MTSYRILRISGTRSIGREACKTDRCVRTYVPAYNCCLLYTRVWTGEGGGSPAGTTAAAVLLHCSPRHPHPGKRVAGDADCWSGAGRGLGSSSDIALPLRPSRTGLDYILDWMDAIGGVRLSRS